MSAASLASQLRPQFFKTGPLPKVEIPGASAPPNHVGPNQENANAETGIQTQGGVPYVRLRKQDAFADAVRQKEKWYLKILEQEELSKKWIDEAGLPDTPQIQALITDLKREARRICSYDLVIRLEPLRLPDRPLPIEDIQSAVAKANTYLRVSQYGIDTPKLYEDVGAYVADDVIPRVLHEELVHELDALANRQPKDFHPGSGGKVQDIVHPSLYPYMVNKTTIHDGVKAPQTERGRFITQMQPKTDWGADGSTLQSSFAWIPTVFAISPNGFDVSIEGYINGLGSREQYPTLFRLLEETFKLVMPLLERTVAFDFDANGPENPSYRRYEKRRDYWENSEGTSKEMPGYKELLARQDIERKEEQEQQLARDAQKVLAAEAERQELMIKEVPKDPPVSTWAGKKLKVVVKAANYILEPGQEYSGTWHIEGMPHERIVASAIYYYERDPSIVDAGLYLRRKREGENDWPGTMSAHRDNFGASIEIDEEDEEDYQDGEDDIYFAPSDYGPDPRMGDLPSYNNLGVIPTISEDRPSGTGRVITFPNWVQHCVHSVYNDPTTTGSATRKILCFFLVDDSNTSDTLDFPGFTYTGLDGNVVLTTSDIPAQDGVCNVPTLALLLRMACRQRTAGRLTLPLEVVEHIVKLGQQGEGWGMSREDAEIRRRKLMIDRKVQTKGVNDLWEVEFSLCEH